MDAISFVLGLSARALRGEKLADLVWTGGAGAAAKTASVALHYVVDAGEVDGFDEGDELVFSRHISASGSSSYRVNGEDVTAEAYAEALESINVSIKKQNFLVFQGDVETIANKNPRDLLRHFEVFSGSLDLKCVLCAAAALLPRGRVALARVRRRRWGAGRTLRWQARRCTMHGRRSPPSTPSARPAPPSARP